MPFYGCIVVIKRTGADGSTYPLMNKECLLGRAEGCDIRIQLPIVSKEHARISITVEDGKAFLTALSKTNPTKLNGQSVDNGCQNPLYHKDQFTIGDRHFRWEFPEGSPHCVSRGSSEAPAEAKTEAVDEPSPAEELHNSATSLEPEQIPVTKRLAELEAESTPVSKRKRVSFGPAVTPEYIDKNLPPDTPVRKGSLPSLGSNESVCESPRPDSLARSLAIRRSVSKRVSTQPAQAGIAEESSPRGVLKRTESPPGLIKKSSGSRASPRVSSSLAAGYEDLFKNETAETSVQENTTTDTTKDNIEEKPKKVATPKSAKKKLNSESNICDWIDSEETKEKAVIAQKEDLPEEPKPVEIPDPTVTKSDKNSNSSKDTHNKNVETPVESSESEPVDTVASKVETSVVKKNGTPKIKSETKSGRRSSIGKKTDTPVSKDETPVASKEATPAKNEISSDKPTPKKAGRPAKSPNKDVVASVETPTNETKNKRRSKSIGKNSEPVNNMNDEAVVHNDNSPKDKINLEKDSKDFYGPNPAKTPKGANNVPKTPAPMSNTPKKAGRPSKTPKKEEIEETVASSETPVIKQAKDRRKSEGTKSAKKSVSEFEESMDLAIDDSTAAIAADDTPKNRKSLEKKDSKAFYGPNPAKTPKGANNVPKTPAPKKTPVTKKGIKRKSSISPPSNKSKKLKIEKLKKGDEIPSAVQTNEGPRIKIVDKLPKTPKVSKTPKTKTPRSAIKISTKTPLPKKATLWSEIVKRNAVKAAKAEVSTKTLPLKKNLKRLKQPLGKMHTPKKPKGSVSSFGSPETFFITKSKTSDKPVVVTPKKTPKSPKATTPKAVTPKTATPKSVTLKTATPKATTPKAATPKTATPKTTTPKAATPKPTTPKAATPKVTTPKATTPKPTSPKAVTPKPTTPKAATPKPTTPKAATPKAKTPKVATPKASTPKASTPKAATPKVATPKSETPSTTPKAKTPNSSTPKTKTSKAATPVAEMEMLQTPPRGLEMKTPKDSVLSSKASKTPKSASLKLKTKTPKTIGKKTPKVIKSVKKSTLWSEVVRKNLGKTPNKKVSRAQVAVIKAKKPLVKPARKLHTPKKPKSSVSSVDNFESPETFYITSRKTTAKPAAETKKGRKSIIKKDRKIEPDNSNYEGMADVFGTPGVKDDVPEVVVAAASPATKGASAKKKSSEKRFPKNLSHVGTHKRLSMGSPVITPKNKLLARIKTPNSARSRKSIHSFHSSPASNERLSQSLSISSDKLNETDFDFDSVETPTLPVDMLVSPMEGSGGKQRRSRSSSNTPKADYTNVDGVRQLLKTPGLPPKSPANNLEDVKGVKQLMKTPGPPPKSPANDLTDVKGVKKLLKTPGRPPKSPANDISDVRGVKALLKTPGPPPKSPSNDLTDIKGVKKLMKTPGRPPKSPANDLTDVKGVKKLLKTPGRPPKTPTNDLTDLKGVKQLMKTPSAAPKEPVNDLTNVGGVKKLMATPKLQKGPANDLSQVGGVKKMFATPKQQKEPSNDLTNVFGVKKILTTPKEQKEGLNDLTNIAGVKKIFATPKAQKDGLNELSDVGGVKQIFSSPRQQKSPKNDLTNVGGVKQLMTTPKAPQNSPIADYSHVVGVRKLLRTPGVPSKSPNNELTDFEGVADLVSTPEEPSTSSGGRNKNKRTAGDAFVDSEPVKKSAKRSDQEEESIPSTSSVTRPVSSRGARGGQTSPAKTSRGSKGSPGMEIPKFNIEEALEDREDSPVATVEETTEVVVDDPVDDSIKPEEPKLVKSTRKAKPVRRGRGRRGVEIVSEVEPRKESEVPENEVVPEPVQEELKSTSVPPKKGGRRATKKDEVIPEEPVEDKEAQEPAPVSKRGGRRGTKKDVVTEEATVVTEESVVEEIKAPTPVQKKGGRRGTKKEIVPEGASAVSEQPVVEEIKAPTPVPKKGGRRGVKKEIVPEEIPNVSGESVVEEVEEPIPVPKESVEEVQVPTPAPKRGGRRGAKKEVVPEEASVVSEDSVVEAESKEPTPAKKGGRRGAKKDVVEEETVVEPVVEETVKAPIAKKGGRRGKKDIEPVEVSNTEPTTATVISPVEPTVEESVVEDKVESPVVKKGGRKGRKTAQSVELPKEETRAEESTKSVDSHMDENIDLAPVKPLRGRGGGRAKKVLESSISSLSEETSSAIKDPVEVETVEEIAPKVTTGKRVSKKNVVEDVNEEETNTEATEEAEISLPKSSRGRRGAKKAEEKAEEAVEAVIKHKRGRKGAKVESEETIKSDEIVKTEENIASETVSAAPATKGRKRAKAADPEPEPTTPPTKRGRRGAVKAADELVKTSTPAKKVGDVILEVSTDTKSTSTSKAVTFAEEELGATASYKGRGRKAAVKVDASPELPKSAARGGRAASKAASSKISKDLDDMANLNKKKRRPTSSDREDNSSEEVVAKRGSRKAEASVAEEPKPKRATRGRK